MKTVGRIRRPRVIIGSISSASLLAAVVAANWLTSTYGFIPVGLGLSATAGTVAAGFALAMRDATQDALGKRWMLSVVAVAAGISYMVADPVIALASVVAFAAAELIDFAVYTPIRTRSRFGDRRWAVAVTASSLAGALADTVVFLAIAFGWASVLPALLGQLLGKAWATGLYLIVGKAVANSALLRQSQQPESA